jgi:hypothetical protein
VSGSRGAVAVWGGAGAGGGVEAARGGGLDFPAERERHSTVSRHAALRAYGSAFLSPSPTPSCSLSLRLSLPPAPYQSGARCRAQPRCCLSPDPDQPLPAQPRLNGEHVRPPGCLVPSPRPDPATATPRPLGRKSEEVAVRSGAWMRRGVAGPGTARRGETPLLYL